MRSAWNTPAAAAALSAVLLSGCMTGQEAQNMMAIADIASGATMAAANLGVRVPSEVWAAQGAAQAASAAAFIGSQPSGGSGGGFRGFGMGNGHNLPDTPACRDYLATIRTQGSVAVGTIDPRGSQVRIVEAYQRCLASAPDHPESKRQQCGKGRYRAFVGGRWVCGTEEARMALGR